MELGGKRALVTGASSGLGEALARDLAGRGASLVITARRQDRLERLARELREQRGTEVQVVALDLSVQGAPERLWEATEGAGKVVDILVNNAGFGVRQAFLEIPWERTREQLQLNVVAVTELTWRFARSMAARRRGRILNVASIGAFLPCPDYATYGAGKAFVRDFSEALAYELKPHGVTVTALCPGQTETEFHQVAGHPVDASMRAVMMSAAECAREGVDALLEELPLRVPGVFNAVSMWALRWVPRRLLPALAAVSTGQRRE